MNIKNMSNNEIIFTTNTSNTANNNNNDDDLRRQRQRRRYYNDFANAKAQCLGKRDKSFQGRIDPGAVEVCGIINERTDMYTTSSCAGRCFLYRGIGNKKATIDFQRFRISHQIITDPTRYFDLTTLDKDPTGGADPIRTIGQYDYKQLLETKHANQDQDENNIMKMKSNRNCNMELLPSNTVDRYDDTDDTTISPLSFTNDPKSIIWLRYEPFILHVACRSMSVASMLMAAARPAFKNVGLTTWKDNRNYLVAIWGDEGLEMPLTTPTGIALYQYPKDATTKSNNNINNDHHHHPSNHHHHHHHQQQDLSTWLAQLCNERHERNWNKIQRFCQNLREMPPSSPDDDDTIHHDEDDDNDNNNVNYIINGIENDESHYQKLPYNKNGSNDGISPSAPLPIIPKSFDVIGDIAYLHSLPEEIDPECIGKSILNKNKSIKIVVARRSNLQGTDRAPGEDGLTIIAGVNRYPLMTTHTEYGIKCIVDLNHTFFSPRMGQERLRICQQVARGEHVLVCFGGVGMEALQICGRTEASRVVYIELNPIAVECAQKGLALLRRNKSVQCAGAAQRLQILAGDVLEVIPTLQEQQQQQQQECWFDRILAPRPKEGKLDSDLGSCGHDGEGGGIEFLKVILPCLKDGGECHWYDFVADWEFPACQRTKALIQNVCTGLGWQMQVLHVAKVGSVAMRQYRVCLDFKVWH
jgi:tRNA G37 N-methylase Trm5